MPPRLAIALVVPAIPLVVELRVGVELSGLGAKTFQLSPFVWAKLSVLLVLAELRLGLVPTRVRVLDARARLAFDG